MENKEWLFSGLGIIIITAFVSLFLSYKKNYDEHSKLKIRIENPKFDCFFGDCITEKGFDKVNRICGMNIVIVNSCNVDIELININLKIRNEVYRLIPVENNYWNVVFFLQNPTTKLRSLEQEDFDSNYGVYYAENGICTPCKINAYSHVKSTVLFYDFPCKIKKQCSAKLMVNTTMCSINKRYKLYEYNDTFAKREWEYVKQNMKSK